MARSPVLAGERLDLVPFHNGLLSERYVGWLNDPAIVRYSEQRHRIHTLESCRAYADSFASSDDYFWAVVARDPALGHIGNLSATVSRPNGVADLAILIGEPRVRGKGYGLEAWKCACAYLLADAGLRKVTAGTMASNAPMLAVMRAAGMREEGRRQRQFLVEGAEVDAVYFALFASKIP